MFTQTNIVEKLNFFDINCDIEEVEKLIKLLRLEPIFEDEKGQIYYDDEAYEIIKRKLEIKKSQYETKEAEIVKDTPLLEQTAQTSALTTDKTGKNL